MITFLRPEQYQANCQALYLRYEACIAKNLKDAQIHHIRVSTIAYAVSKGDLDIYVDITADQCEQSIRKIKVIHFV